MGTSNSLVNLWELQLARDVQNRLFPAGQPSIPGLDYYSDWRPAPVSSGDYLDYFEMDEGNLGLAIGDVGGRGLQAALLTASLHSIVRALRFSQPSSLGDFVSTVDELFCEIAPDNCYATLFISRYDPVSGRLHYVNAGHEPPFLRRKTAGRYRTIRLEPAGPLLGMLRKSSYREGVVTLCPGDLLVAYTDGLCDATNEKGEQWGWQRFLESIQIRGRARDIVSRVFDAADAFAHGNTQFDDMTLWVARVEDSHRQPIVQLVEACEEPVAA